MDFEKPKKPEEQAVENAESLYGKFNSVAAEAEQEGGRRVEQISDDGAGDLYVENKDGLRLYDIHFKPRNQDNPDAGTEYYYEQTYSYDESDRVSEIAWRDIASESGGNAGEKHFGYDDQGHLISEEQEITGGPEEGKKIGKNFDYSEQGEMAGEIGEIKAGPDRGHKWQKRFSSSVLEDGTQVSVEDGQILEQGENKKKEQKGHAWRAAWETKDKSTVHGGKITGGPELGRTWGEWNKLKTAQ